MIELTKGFLSPNRKPSEMIINDYSQLRELREGCRILRLTVGLTQGSMDLKHVGHDRFIMAASELCDVLVVGIDSDEKIRKKKGPSRPVVSQDERMEQVCYIRGVNIVTLKKAEDEHLALLKAVRPDVLVISTATKDGAEVPEYSEEELAERRPFCGRIEVLPPQAPTSTTARVRTLMLDFTTSLKGSLTTALPELVEKVSADFFQKAKEPK